MCRQPGRRRCTPEKAEGQVGLRGQAGCFPHSGLGGVDTTREAGEELGVIKGGQGPRGC